MAFPAASTSHAPRATSTRNFKRKLRNLLYQKPGLAPGFCVPPPSAGFSEPGNKRSVPHLCDFFLSQGWETTELQVAGSFIYRRSATTVGDYYQLVPNRRVTPDLDRLVAALEADPSLMDPNELRKRIQVLDHLDTYFADAAPISDIHARARALRLRLEAANSAVYESIRSQLRHGAKPEELLLWFEPFMSQKKTPSPGLGYDDLDELMSGLLQLREPAHAPTHPASGMVFYQPTPVRHILHLIAATKLSEADVLVDLGSGLGHVPLLASILTAARTIGIELEAEYVASAHACAQSLGLSRVTFVQQDARDADFSTGTVFYMYTPFTGALLTTVLGKLERERADRAFRVCTFGPCTPFVAKELWLTPTTVPDPDRITCFLSNT